MGADNAEAGRILPGFIKSIPFLLYTVALAQPSPPGGPSKASPSPICWPMFPAPIPTRAAFPPGSKNSHRTSQLHKYYMNEVFVPQHMDEPHHYGGFVHTAHTPGRPPYTPHAQSFPLATPADPQPYRRVHGQGRDAPILSGSLLICLQTKHGVILCNSWWAKEIMSPTVHLILQVERPLPLFAQLASDMGGTMAPARHPVSQT